ncbi:hypothetical protein [Methylorubrum sp. SB2]|uniref:hypothetical protein n=1 Tax=Methylorubrum subtropicum TaxID=3138812 RepID=UPI00313C9935
MLRLFGEEPTPEIEAPPEPPPPVTQPASSAELDDRQPYLEASGFYSSTIMEIHKLDGTIEERFHRQITPIKTKARYPKLIAIQISDNESFFDGARAIDRRWLTTHADYARSMDYQYFIPLSNELIPGRPLFYKMDDGCRVLYEFENSYIASIGGFGPAYWGDAQPEIFDRSDIGHFLELINKECSAFKYLKSKQAYRYILNVNPKPDEIINQEYAPTDTPSRPPPSIIGNYVYPGTRCETHLVGVRPQMHRKETPQAAAARYRDALVIHKDTEAYHYSRKFDYKIDIDGRYVAGELIYVSDVRTYCLVIFPGNYIAQFRWTSAGYFFYEGDADQRDFPPDLFPPEDDD